MPHSDIPQIDIDNAGALWRWLESNHAQSTSVWIVTWKKMAGERYVGREAVLDALIAYGWIDGRRMKHPDPRRTMQLISPRAQQVWAETYRNRAVRLETEGRMTPPGRAAIDSAKASGLWQAWQDVDDLTIPDTLMTAFSAHPGARAWFDRAAPSYRRNVLRFLRGAKTDATRLKRARLIADHAARGQKVPQY